MSIDECRQHVLDEKKKGNVEYDNVIVVGHRNSKHGNPAYKNTCWYIRNNVASDNTTVNAIGHVDDVHQIACVDSDGNPIKCNISKENCDGMTGHYYSDSDNLCKPHTTCPNGQQLDGATGISAGTCKWCHELGAKYKNSGQNRSKCEDQYTCPNGKQLVGASNTSPGICKWCHELGAKYKNSGQNRSKCADQHTCPNGQQLVDASNTRPGICKWCHELGAKYKIVVKIEVNVKTDINVLTDNNLLVQVIQAQELVNGVMQEIINLVTIGIVVHGVKRLNFNLLKVCILAIVQHIIMLLGMDIIMEIGITLIIYHQVKLTRGMELRTKILQFTI